MSDEGFDPDDINELDEILEEMVADNNSGFVVEFGVSVLAAKELIDLWELAEEGDRDAYHASWNEYTKIILQLEQAIYGEDG